LNKKSWALVSFLGVEVVGGGDATPINLNSLKARLFAKEEAKISRIIGQSGRYID
jgi:hypothetical protein